jgi:hypothetical protein
MYCGWTKESPGGVFSADTMKLDRKSGLKEEAVEKHNHDDVMPCTVSMIAVSRTSQLEVCFLFDERDGVCLSRRSTAQ